MLRLLTAGAAIVLAFSVAGCTTAPFEEATGGHEGILEFTLHNMPVNHPLLINATATVGVWGAEPDTKLTARAKGASAKVTGFTPWFDCASEREDGGRDTRHIEADEQCAEGEEREVVWTADIVAAKPGALTLEILDDSGEVIDWVTLESASAARADFTLDDEPVDISKGVTLAIGQPHTLGVRGFFDAKGRYLEAKHGSIAWSFEDAMVVKSGDVEGDPAETVIEGVKTGTTTVTAHAGDFSQAVAIDVMGD